MNIKRKILKIIFILLGLMFGLSTLWYLSRNANTNDIEDPSNTNIPISSPISYISNHPSQVIADSITFELQFASIDMRNPYLDVYVKFNSNSKDDINSKLINSGRYLIYNEDFDLIIQTGGEGIPFGLETPIPEYKKIANLLGKDLNRVEYSKDTNIQALFQKTNQERPFLYFYSDSFKHGLECGSGYESYFCGGDSIRMKPLTDGNKLSYKIYCGVDDQSNVKYCDEIVSNLTIEVKDLRL